MNPLRLESIHSGHELAALRDPWTALWEQCPSATPFQAPAWLLPWWRHLGRGKLAVVAAWEGDRLVALAPWFTARYFGLPLRRLCLLGTGNTDYLDVLVHPDHPEAVVQLLHHAATLPGWDFADFQQLAPGAILLGAPAPSGYRDSIRRQEVCPVLDLPPGPDPFQAAVSSRIRSNLRYYRRKLEAAGGTFAAAHGDGVDRALGALFELHQARWRRRRLPGVFSDTRVRSFHAAVAEGFDACGWLRLHTLELQSDIAAALYCFHCRGRGYYYAGGFDPALARLSPGTVLTGHAIAEAAREGAREFDFLRGDEPYKYDWGAHDRTNSRRLLWRLGTPGALAPRLVALESRLEHAVKRLARRWQAGR